MTYKEWQKAEHNYDVITTYWEDFSIAEHFGLDAIRDTYKRALYNKDYKMMTELVMVLNHKIWFWYQKNEEVARLYDELWRECHNKCCNTLKGKELSYYLEVLD